MKKRGRRKYEQPDAYYVMPLRVIAERMQLSERTVETVYASALGKLKKMPGAGKLLIAACAAKAILKSDLPHASSAECNREFVEQWRTGKSK